MKLLIILDHFESDMFNVSNHQVSFDINKSVIGKILKNKIINHPKTGIATKSADVTIDFFFKRVPKQNSVTKAYTKPGVHDLEKALNDTINNIKKCQPDLIVSYGGWFRNAFASKYDIKNTSYELTPVNIDGKEIYVSFCPSLKKLVYMTSSERDRLLIENRMINRFLKGGIENTKPQFGKYKLVTDYKEVAYIFNSVLSKQSAVAVDFETNTLNTYLDGAKALMISLSWREHEGISIPLEYRGYQTYWTEAQFNAIIEMIKRFMQSDTRKVFHNGLYDIRMLMDIYGLESASNCVDTMLMYYETVDESQGALRGLKHLAYIYTDMGGYEDERDKDFENYIKNDYDAWFKKAQQDYDAGIRKRKPTKTQYPHPVNPVDGSKTDFEWLSADTIFKYASADTDVTLQLYHIFDKNVQKRPIWKYTCYDFYPKLCETLCYITHTGLLMDSNKLQEYREHYTEEQASVVDQMYKLVPEIHEFENERLAKVSEREAIKKIKPKDRTPEQQKKFTEYAKYSGKNSDGVPKYKFNPGSAEHVGYILFHMLGYQLPPESDYLKPSAVSARKLSHPEKLTWSDYKTDRVNALPYLVKTYNDPLAKLLLTYSNDKKMISGVVNSYSDLADGKSYLHPQFLPQGTVTGRLASRNPNGQNFKKPTSDTNDPNYKYPVKGLFKSRFDDGYIVNVDYKSLEVFIASLISKDVGMMQALMDGADIHKRNASIAFNIPVDEVDKTHRQLAKSVTFGLLYGESPQGLADSRGLTIEEANQTFDKVLGAMPQMKKAIDATQNFAEQKGYVETLSGHVRRLPEATLKNDYSTKSRALRQSFNAVVQGSGSFVTNLSLILICQALRKFGLKSKVVLTVHDSIVLDIPAEEMLTVPAMVRKIMANPPIKSFILERSDFPDLNVADKYMINRSQFRFPLFPEIEFGKTYADGLDYDLDRINEIGLDNYYNYGKECKFVSDKYNTMLAHAEDENSKASIVEEMDSQLDEIKNKYFKGK